MEITSQQQFNQIANKLQKLTLNQIPPVQAFMRQAFLSALKGIKQLLLTYPLNVLIIVICLIWIIHKVISRFTNSKINVYWPNIHIESHDQHIRNLKKDIREIQSESLSFSRKMEGKKKQKQQKLFQQVAVNNLNSTSDIQSQLKSLLQQRQYIKDVSTDFITEIRKSEEEIIKKIRKHKR